MPGECVERRRNMTKRTLLIAGRLFFGLLTLFAIGYQLVYLARLGVLNVVNFFSYFTNLSNICASVVFLVGAVFLLQRREPSPAQDLIRGASVVAMVIVFIVYGLLLRDVDLGKLLPWVNVIIHYVFPLVVLADWLYQPPISTLRFGQTGYWLIYLIRAPALRHGGDDLLPTGNLRGMVQMFAWAMNPGLVGVTPSAPAQAIECSACCWE
jgi:hypothetical protein